jgi:hypothetical protein
MFKRLFFIMCALLLTQLTWARTIIRSYEDYVHLSNEQKDQLIIKTMELATELEARYEKDLAAYGYNQERYERYVKALNTFSALFIDSAYAAKEQKSWEAIGADFIKLMDKPNSRCLFAGWVSNPVKDKSGKTVCAHPGKKHDKSQEAQAYPDPGSTSACRKDDPKKIQCSPVIFGYKSEADKSLFCVEATSGAHNSSFKCMKEALASDKKQAGDSKEVRLKNLRDRLAKHPEIFKGVQEFAYKTCVCETTKENFDKDYHKYMRPHRTCYGLMEMMAETTMCEAPKLIDDFSIFKALRDYTRKSASEVDEKLADSQYKLFVTSEVQKTAPKEYARLCGEGLTVAAGTGNKTPEKTEKVEPPIQQVKVTGKTYKCEAVCTPRPKASKKTDDIDKDDPTASLPYLCDMTVTEKDGKKAEFETTPKEQPESDKATVIVVENKINGKEVSVNCKLTIEKTPEKKDDGSVPTLKLEGKKADKSFNITAIVTNQGDWIVNWIPTVPASTPKKEEKQPNRPGLSTPNNSEDKNSEDKKPEDKKPEDKKPEDKKPEDVNDKSEGKEESKEEGNEKTYPRKDVSYKVCAELKKGDMPPIQSTNCIEVEPIEKPAKPSVRAMGPNQQQMMPQKQYRQSFDVSGEGVR